MKKKIFTCFWLKICHFTKSPYFEWTSRKYWSWSFAKIQLVFYTFINSILENEPNLVNDNMLPTNGKSNGPGISQRCVLGPFFKPRTRTSILFFLFSGTRTRASILFYLFPRTRTSKWESLEYPCFFQVHKIFAMHTCTCNKI